MGPVPKNIFASGYDTRAYEENKAAYEGAGHAPQVHTPPAETFAHRTVFYFLEMFRFWCLVLCKNPLFNMKHSSAASDRINAYDGRFDSAVPSGESYVDYQNCPLMMARVSGLSRKLR